MVGKGLKCACCSLCLMCLPTFVVEQVSIILKKEENSDCVCISPNTCLPTFKHPPTPCLSLSGYMHTMNGNLWLNMGVDVYSG